MPTSGLVTALTSTLSNDQLSAISAAAERHRDEIVTLAQKMIRIPSMSGEEGELAQFVAAWLMEAGYDDVWTDPAGNVVGALRGGNGNSVQFNSHLDHVSVGDLALWSYAPFEGVIEGDTLFGRGASDIKGALACQMAIGPVLRDAGLLPSGDVLLAAVVLEEVGGFGSEYLARELPTDIAVLGESTKNQINRGHRGRVYVEVSFRGLSAHASAPDRARNPHFACARFLQKLESMPMKSSGTFGSATAAPTLIQCDHSSGNVTPADVTVYIDWRSLPIESETEIAERVRQLAYAAAGECDGIVARVAVAARPVSTYTGLTSTMPSTRGYELDADDPVVTTAVSALQQGLGRAVEVGAWTFATDGGHLAAAGTRTIGFAPGEEKFAHTIWDQISLSLMHEAVIGNAILALELTALDLSRGV